MEAWRRTDQWRQLVEGGAGVERRPESGRGAGERCFGEHSLCMCQRWSLKRRQGEAAGTL